MRCNIRKAFALCFPLLLCLFYSCTPQTESAPITAVAEDEIHTIKKEALARKNNLEWTEELRKPEEAVEETEASEPGVYFSETLKISIGPDESLIYPSMPNLGNMDISKMSNTLYTKLTSFLTGLKAKSIKSDDAVFAEKYVGVILLYELSFYPDINSWYIGTPFISQEQGNNTGNVYEIPLLILTKNGKFNCWISIDGEKASANEFLVKQVTLGALS
ncbi:MAG: hypothetical protein K5930_10040 [Treponemataceae bacterium]|nr:hypothetical protein [Treponemataceae bacterium]